MAVTVTAPVAATGGQTRDPGTLETVAVEVFDDDQVTLSVRFLVLRSE